LSLEKFWLERYGVQLPVSMQYSEGHGVPKFIPNTDARVNQDNVPDSIRSFDRTVTYNARFSKTQQSPSRLINFTIERLNLDWSHTYDKSTDYTSGHSVSKTSRASANYKFPTKKGRGLTPLIFFQSAPFLSLLGQPRLYFKPTSLDVMLSADQRDSRSRSQQGQRTINQSFTMKQSLSTGFEPFDPLSIGFDRGHTTVHRSDSVKQRGWAEFLAGDFGKLTQVQQTFNTNYNPSFANWFQPSLSYNARYNWSHSNLDQENGQNIQNNRTVGGDVTLDFRQILGGESRRGRRGGDGRSTERPSPEPEVAEGDSASADTIAVETESGPSLGERLSSVFSPIRKALTVIDPVSLGYDNSLSHSQAGTIGQGSLAYQFGLTQEAGTDTAAGFNNRPSLNSSEGYSARSGLKITRNISTQFNWRYNTTEDKQTQVRRSYDQTMFWLGADGGDPTTLPFVDISANWVGLERISFLSKATEAVSLSSSLSNSQRETETGESEAALAPQSREFTRQWSPLLGVDVSWVGGIDTQIRYNQQSSYRQDLLGDGRSRTSGSTASATVSYTIHTGFRLPSLWFSAIRMENQTTFSMNVDYTTNTSEQSAASSSEFSPQTKTTQWSLQPRMSYSFSNTVQGQAHVMLQETKDELTDTKNRLFEFGIQVNIAIRG
jgi:hypothetical protein